MRNLPTLVLLVPILGACMSACGASLSGTEAAGTRHTPVSVERLVASLHPNEACTAHQTHTTILAARQVQTVVDCLDEGRSVNVCLLRARDAAGKPQEAAASERERGVHVLLSDCRGHEVYFCGSVCGGEPSCVRNADLGSLDCHY